MCGAPSWTAGCLAGPLAAGPGPLLMPRLTTPRYTHTHTNTSMTTHKKPGKQFNTPSAAVWALFSFSASALTPVSHVYSGNGGSSCRAGGREQIEGLWNDSVADRQQASSANSSQPSYSHRFLPLWSTTLCTASRSVALWLQICFSGLPSTSWISQNGCGTEIKILLQHIFIHLTYSQKHCLLHVGSDNSYNAGKKKVNCRSSHLQSADR